MRIIYKLPSRLYARLSEIKAKLLYNFKYNKTMRRGIFLHSMFRSGSTYIFKKFREEPQFWCYYEPFHHQLAHLEEGNLEIFRYDKVAADRMNHPHLMKPHFHEYHLALKNAKLNSFSPVIAYDDFSVVKHHALTFKYIANLLNAAPQNTCPVLQFNRSSLRIKWLKTYFKDCQHVYLLRPPRDQFESYCQAGKFSGNIFLTMNVYILEKNFKYGHFNKAYEKINGKFLLSNRIFDDLELIGSQVDTVPLEIHYEIFLHLWFASLIHGTCHSDLVVEMQKLGVNRNYTKTVVDKLSSFRKLPPDIFNDAKLKKYDSYSLDKEKLRKVETNVFEIYNHELSKIDQEYFIDVIAPI